MKNEIGFKRHLRPEKQTKKRATFGSTFRPFQSVELSLLRLLLSRAEVRFTQLNKNKLTTDTVRYTLPRKWHERGILGCFNNKMRVLLAKRGD